MNLYFQTGDVLYFQIKELPKDVIDLKTDLFHKGDNHSHKVKGDFSIFKLNNDMFLECKSECELYHEEHKSIMIPIGIYKKGIVLEYDHLKEESRKVID